jgi:hypothetical protein
MLKGVSIPDGQIYFDSLDANKIYEDFMNKQIGYTASNVGNRPEHMSALLSSYGYSISTRFATPVGRFVKIYCVRIGTLTEPLGVVTLVINDTTQPPVLLKRPDGSIRGTPLSVDEINAQLNQGATAYKAFANDPSTLATAPLVGWILHG